MNTTKPFGEDMTSAVELGVRTVDFARLADWVEGHLSEEEAVAVEKRVAAADETTLADVAWLRRFAEISQRVVLPPPPPRVHETLVDHFEAYIRDKQRPGLRKRLVATLTFDSGSRSTVVGIRQTTNAPELTRQLVYATDASDIALDILPQAHDESRLDLEGQVLPNDEDIESGFFRVQLLRGETELGTTVTDDLGEFAFESVPPGVYEMLLSTDKYDIVVAPVEVEIEM